MPVTIERDVSLAPFNTFGVDVRAAHFVRVRHADELDELLDDAGLRTLPRLVLGGGSNLLLTRDFDGVVIRIEIPGFERRGIEGDAHLVRVGAGENWHATVERLLDEGLPGVENLALIPGSTGAAPIQNIGAYGLELAERFQCLEARDTTTGRRVVMDAAQCGFGYRDSVFRHEPGRYVVLAVTLALPRQWRPVTGYADVENELRSRGLARPAPRDVFDAVVAIRRRKLPDPALIGNAGSFFKNPVVSAEQCRDIIGRDPSVVHYPLPDGHFKLAAGWLIDACGWKGKSVGRAGVYERQALVLVNRGGAIGAEVLTLARAIQESVYGRFGIRLEPEPVIL